MKKFFYLSIPVFLLMFFACGSADFEQANSGLTYKIHKSNRGDKPVIDNIVKVDMAFRYPADSVFMRNLGYHEEVYLSVQPSEYSGDIHEGMRMLAKGDSITFKIDASQFFTVTMRSPNVPEFIAEGDSIYIDVKMVDFFTQEEFDAYQQKRMEDEMKDMEVAAEQEDGIREQYLQDHDIMVTPEESGLVIVVNEEGDGPRPQAGQKVSVHYTGMLLDGTVFDTSEGRNPFTFTLGAGQVIRGWDEGISKLNVGTKATLVIPSHLAYGDRNAGEHITPYSSLVFEIEVLDVE